MTGRDGAEPLGAGGAEEQSVVSDYTIVTAIGAYTGGLIPGTSGFGKTYIGFPALQAWATGAVLYLLAVALVARRARASELLGYARVGELPGLGTATTGGG